MTPQQRRRAAVDAALREAATNPWREGAHAILRALGYDSPKTLETGGDPAAFARALELDASRLPRLAEWRSLDLVFQLTGDELPALARGAAPTTGERVQRGAIDSFLFLAADLAEADWPRRDLVAIVREINRATSMPAVLLFRHGGRATIAVIDRRDHRRLAQAQVIGGRVSLIKDIELASPHRAHLQILADLSLTELAERPRQRSIADFRTLYDAWLDTLSAAELNRRFYGELADWFAWASTMPGVSFPKGQGTGEGAKETALIRLLTRLMFVWFIKEKGLVPGELFARESLRSLLAEAPDREGYSYYTAVLQNLFFATLNTEWGKRDWRKDKDVRGGAGSSDYLGHHVLRRRAAFTDPDAALRLFDQVPFLNGGLFECLDREIAADDSRRELGEREGARLILRIDGFSDQPDKQPRLPNALFFGGEAGVDLSGWFQNRKRASDVPGLIDLFERYKFTVEENTPLEEEAALDPELLGKVFENLLASYNEDTKTTARNKSGSFYTPREVVDFMVDEALVAWLGPKLATSAPERGMATRTQALDFGAAPGELALEHPAATGDTGRARSPDDARLRALLNYAAREHGFTDAEADRLIEAIEVCRAIDPAVGSGAFPLGLLQKLVHVLSLLDPGGEKWRLRNRAYFARAVEEADKIGAPDVREAALEQAGQALAKFDEAFASGHYPDYTRKLFLIERCLHGVDVQPIAVQIAKLRCFISLAVEQRVNDDRPNRGITPLPNLETKFVAANTLTPLHKRQGTLATQDLFAKQRALREANRAFFAAANGAAKRAAQKRIRGLREEIAAELSREGAYPNADAAALAHWDPFDPNAFAPFFDGEWMFGLEPSATEGWFDIAFANPPYVRQEKIEGFRINGQVVLQKAQLKRDYATYAGTADLYIYFYERALRLLKPDGALAFITSNAWYRSGYGKSLRGWLVEQARILKLINFGDAPVFEAIAYPTILIATRRETPAKPSPSETICAYSWACPPGEAPKEAVKRFPAQFAIDAFALPQSALALGGWQFEPQAERDLLRRLRERGTPLAQWCGERFYRGILTGLNDAFVIPGWKRAEMIADDPKSAELIKPFLRGRDVKRWGVEPADKWLIFTRRGIDLDSYPAVKKHLEGFREQLEPKPADWKPEHKDDAWKGRKGGSYKWFEIQDNVAYWTEFEQPKIIVPAIEQRVAYAPDSGMYFSNDKTSIVVTDRANYALGFLNSSVSWWITQQDFASRQGGFYEFKPMYVGKLPIPTATPEQEALVTIAVDAILAGAGERARLEALLNAFIYELFFPEDLAAANLSPFRAARDAGLPALAQFTGPALAREADAWTRHLADPASPLYATLFGLQAIDAVRIIEGR